MGDGFPVVNAGRSLARLPEVEDRGGAVAKLRQGVRPDRGRLVRGAAGATVPGVWYGLLGEGSTLRCPPRLRGEHHSLARMGLGAQGGCQRRPPSASSPLARGRPGQERSAMMI